MSHRWKKIFTVCSKGRSLILDSLLRCTTLELCSSYNKTQSGVVSASGLGGPVRDACDARRRKRELPFCWVESWVCFAPASPDLGVIRIRRAFGHLSRIIHRNLEKRTRIDTRRRLSRAFGERLEQDGTETGERMRHIQHSACRSSTPSAVSHPSC